MRPADGLHRVRTQGHALPAFHAARAGFVGDEFGVALHIEEGSPYKDVRAFMAEGTPYIELSSQFDALFVCVSTLKDGDEVVVVEKLKKALAVR